MASKRSILALMSVAFLLPSCALVRMSKKDSSSEGIYSHQEIIESDFSNESIHSSLQSVHEPPIEPTPSIESTIYEEPIFDYDWESLETWHIDGESIYDVRRNYSTGHEALVIPADSYVAISEGGGIKPGGDGIKLAGNDQWIEYRFTLDNNRAVSFSAVPLVIYGGADSSLFRSSSTYSPTEFSLLVNGEEVEINNRTLYMDMGLEPMEAVTPIYWNSESQLPLTEGFNTIRITRTGSGNLWMYELWFTNFPFRLQPYF